MERNQTDMSSAPKPRLDDLAYVFTRPLTAFTVGKTISASLLLEYGLESQSRIFSPIDDSSFIEGVIESGDSGKIDLAAMFCRLDTFPFTFGHYSDIFLKGDNLTRVAGNPRNGDCSLKFEDPALQSTLLTALTDIKPGHDGHPRFPRLITALVANPSIARGTLAKIIDGKEPYDQIPISTRWYVARSAAQVSRPVDSPRNLSFDAPNQAFFRLVVRALRSETSLDQFFRDFESKGWDAGHFHDVRELAGSECFDVSLFVTVDDTIDYKLERRRAAEKAMAWIEEETKSLSDPKDWSEEDFARAIIFVVLAFCVLDYIKDAKMVANGSGSWVMAAASYAITVEEFIEKLRNLDEMLVEQRINRSFDQTYIDETLKKYKAFHLPSQNRLGKVVGQHFWRKREEFRTDEVGRIYGNLLDSMIESREDYGFSEDQIRLLLTIDVSQRAGQKKHRIQQNLRHSQRLLGGEAGALGKELYAVKAQVLQIDKGLGYLSLAFTILAVILVIAVISR